MKQSKKTYKLHNGFPAYTIEQWFNTYQGFVRTFISTPKSQQKGQMWQDFIDLANKVKSLLIENGIKFI